MTLYVISECFCQSWEILIICQLFFALFCNFLEIFFCNYECVFGYLTEYFTILVAFNQLIGEFYVGQSYQLKGFEPQNL